MTTDNVQGPQADTLEPEVLAGLRSLRDLDREINEPTTELGKRYMVFVAMTVVASIFFLFVSDEYPSWFPPDSVQLFVVELFIFCIFTLDFILRLAVIKPSIWRSCLLLLCDALAIVPSAMVVLVFVGLCLCCCMGEFC